MHICFPVVFVLAIQGLHTSDGSIVSDAADRKMALKIAGNLLENNLDNTSDESIVPDAAIPFYNNLDNISDGSLVPNTADPFDNNLILEPEVAVDLDRKKNKNSKKGKKSGKKGKKSGKNNAKKPTKKPGKTPGGSNTQSCECGVKKSSKIVNGQEAQEFEWPWMVRLTVAYDFGSFICGGSLIADQWILTAAHCTIEVDGKLPQVTAYLGDHHKWIIDTNEKVLQVSKIINHASYSHMPVLNDIALLKLSEKVDMKKYTPVCLPKRGSTYVGEMADVYGWGKSSFGGSSFTTLQETSVEVITNQACINQRYGHITLKQLCAYTEGTDSCQGDSGGPLTYNDNEKYKQIGVVSYGNGCAEEDFSGVYSRVTEYLGWIKSKTGKNGGAVYCDK